MVSLSFSIYLLKYISIFGICVRFPGGNLYPNFTTSHLPPELVEHLRRVRQMC